MLDNLASYLNSTSNKNLCYTSSQTKSEELLNQLSITNILQKFSKKSKWTVKSLVMYRSTPNLADLSENLPYDKINMLYKNKSAECLANAADHLENFLFNAYQKSSIVEGGKYLAMENEMFRSYSYSDAEKLEDIYKFLNSENTHIVKIKKDNRGLGFSISGGRDSSKSDMFSQLIRVSKLYPLQPAMASENLFVGDIILEVNGTNMIGLTNTEALEFLRSSDCDVTFKVFRPTKHGFPSLTLCKEFWPIALSTSFSKAINGRTSESEKNYSEEFEVTVIKQDGALGFTISKHEEKSCDLKGFYVHDLIKEPAISDGRIHPGDFISKVNGVCISSFTHEEAISLLRSCCVTVTLTLIRPYPPLSPLSLDGEIPLGKPLRWEAIELLNDRMKQKDNGDSTLGKRKVKRKRTSKDFKSAKLSAVNKTDSIIISYQKIPAAEIFNEKLQQECSSIDDGDEEKLDIESSRQTFPKLLEKKLEDVEDKERKFEEFEVTLIKEDGALGFTISKHEEKNCNLKGFYVHDLIREPAISDGRIHPGDFISKVNGVCISSFTHEEAISLLRSSCVTVTLTLIRPYPPLSPLSLDGEIPLGKPLRWEAIELMNDRMKQKNNGDSTFGKEKVKMERMFSNKYALQEENGKMGKKREWRNGEKSNDIDSDFICAKSSEDHKTDSVIISYQKTPAAEIFNEKLQQESSSIDGDEEKLDIESLYQTFPKLLEKKVADVEDREREIKFLYEIVLNRGWHTRLGFSLQDPQDDRKCINCNNVPLCPEVKAVYPGTLAAKDGRIQAKDRLLEVNSELLLGIPARQVIGLLRKKTGRIRMLFCRLAYGILPEENS